MRERDATARAVLGLLADQPRLNEERRQLLEVFEATAEAGRGFRAKLPLELRL